MTRLVVLVVCGALLLISAYAQEPDDDVFALIGQLKAKDPKARRRAAKDLGKRGGEHAIPALGQALGDDSESVRHEAAIALARLAPDNTKVVEVLIESLKKQDWYVRWQACLALQSLGPRAKTAVPTLLSTLRDANVSRETTLALARIAPTDERVVRSLVAALSADQGVDRRMVLFALGQAGPAARPALPWLENEIEKDCHRLREAALSAVARISLPLAVRALRDWRVDVRAAAASALGDVGREAKLAIPSLILRVDDVNRRVRREARNALARVTDGALPSILVPGWWAFSYRQNTITIDPRLGKANANLLDLLTDPAVGPEIMDALSKVRKYDMDPTVAALSSGSADTRACAALLIGRLSLSFDEARVALLQLQKDRSANVRAAATAGLRLLGDRLAAHRKHIPER